jgi:hypothetical protein
MIVQDVVYSTLRLLEVMGSGESPSTEEANDGLAALIALIDNWSALELLPHATRTEPITLIGSTSSYGVSVRPSKIVAADCVISGQTYPIEVVGAEKWASLQDKGDTGPRPRSLFCDYAWPTIAVQFSPIPSTGGTVHLYCITALAAIANLSDAWSYAPGYTRAIKYNLAVDLAAEFGRSVLPEVQTIADATREGLVARNASNRAGQSVLQIPPVPPAGA